MVAAGESHIARLKDQQAGCPASGATSNTENESTLSKKSLNRSAEIGAKGCENDYDSCGRPERNQETRV